MDQQDEKPNSAKPGRTIGRGLDPAKQSRGIKHALAVARGKRQQKAPPQGQPSRARPTPSLPKLPWNDT